MLLFLPFPFFFLFTHKRKCNASWRRIKNKKSRGYSVTYSSFSVTSSFFNEGRTFRKSDTCFDSPYEGGLNGVWWSKKSFKMREEIGLKQKWLITSSAYSCTDCATESFCFLWLRSTWLDSVFDGESEYVDFRNLKRVEGVEISSFLTMM